MADLDCCFITYNCGRALLDPSYFAYHLYQSTSKQSQAPQVIAFALEEVAPISYAFLGGALLEPYLHRFDAVLAEYAQRWRSEGLQYERVHVSNVGMTALMVFAQADTTQRLRVVGEAGVGVGRYEMGNKGAVGVRLAFRRDRGDDMLVTFVGAHLAPMEEAWQRRNQDWKDINENLVFSTAGIESWKRKHANDQAETEPLLSSGTDTPSKHLHRGLYAPGSYLFVAGDLNYRTSDTRPSDTAHESWPQPSSSSDPSHYSHLFENDQLNREKAAGRTLQHLSEATIDFSPTYKYSGKAQEQAGQLAAAVPSIGEEGSATDAGSQQKDGKWHWATHRIPSWCDRVLYLNPPDSATRPVTHEYTSLPLQPSSDHQPVLLLFSLPLLKAPSQDEDGWVDPPYAIRPGWAERRAAARWREMGVGLGAYLALTWEGEILLVGTLLGAVGGWALLKSLLV